MTNTYWSDVGIGWSWLFWFWVLFFLFSSLGNWGYTYRAHRLYSGKTPQKVR